MPSGLDYILRAELCLPKKDVEVLTAVLVNGTFFGSRVFIDCQVKMKSFEWALNQWCALIKRACLDIETHTHRKKAMWGRGRDRGDTPQTRECQRLAAMRQRPLASPETGFLRALVESALLTPWSWTSSPDCEGTNFCCGSHSVCDTLLRPLGNFRT